MTYYITLTLFLRKTTLKGDIFDPFNPLVTHNQCIDAIIQIKPFLLKIGLDCSIEFLKFRRGNIVHCLLIVRRTFHFDKMEYIIAYSNDIDLTEAVINVPIDNPKSIVS